MMEKVYPRTGDTQTVYLNAVVKDPSIEVGDYTIYNDFVSDPLLFERNNVLYHYPINHERLIIGKFCSIACGAKFLFNCANHTLKSLSTYTFPLFYEDWDLEKSDVATAWDNKGDIVIGNDVWIGYEAVQRRMERSGEAIKNGKLKERTRKIVAAAIQTARNRQEFEQELKRQGIDVVFRRNDSGRIYGVTFIDHDSRVVLNGSRLGKEFSANVFNNLYSDERKTDIRQEQQPTHREQPDFTPKADIVSGVSSIVSAFGGLLGGASGGDEPQETASQKRKKKKKKRTRRID